MGFRVNVGHGSKKGIQKAHTGRPQSSQVLRLTSICTLCWMCPGSHLSLCSVGDGISAGWGTAPSKACLQSPDSMEPGTADRSSCWLVTSCPMLNSLSSSCPTQLWNVRSTLSRGIHIRALHRLHLPTGAGGGEWEMAVGVGCWISSRRRAGDPRWQLGRRGDKDGQSRALVPALGLWPTCACQDEEHCFRSAALCQVWPRSSALLCSACC